MLQCSDGEGGVLMVWGSSGLFFKEKLERGRGGRWSRGRIGKVQAHRFKEDPDVYCCIWTAAFGTLTGTEQNQPSHISTPKHFRAVKLNREMFYPRIIYMFLKNQFLVNVWETLDFSLQRRWTSLLWNLCGRLNNGVAVNQCSQCACMQSRTHCQLWLIGENINTHTRWSMTFLWAQAVCSLTQMGRIVKSLH